MKPTIEEARALVADAALWPRARDFLWDFAPQIHPSWLEGLGLGGVPCLSSPRVKKFILSSLGVESVFHAFPKEDWSRLLLLDGATLLEIAKWLGALACAGSLRRVTDGKTVRALKAALPGVYPEVFGFSVYFRRLEGLFGEASPRDAEGVVSAGMSILDSLLAPLPGPLVSRLRLKLPGNLHDSVAPREAKADPAVAGPALAKLLKLKFPEAHKLCC